jgi:nucleoside-diphosphate-sugar epimerase
MAANDFNDVPVLVTGGAGFIGSHLVDALLERGAHVHVLDNFATGKRENLAHCLDRIELIEGDIRDAENCRRASEGVRFVFHQAALGSVPRSMNDPAATISVNVGGTANVFTAARDARVSRVVYASSSSVYGDSAQLPKREGEEGLPLSPYALSKVMNEQLAGIFARCFSMEFVGLRYFNVYGPRQDPDGPYAAVIPRFFKAFLKGEPPVIFGDGEQSRDFTFVADAVLANLSSALAPREACGRAYNVAPGTRTTVNELARAIRDAVGGGPEPIHTSPRAGDVQHSMADVNRIYEAIAFKACTCLSKGIAITAKFYSNCI